MEQRKLLERELDILRDRLLLMGGEVELSIQRAIHALVQRDSDVANQVLERDGVIDRMELEIDRLSVVAAPHQMIGARVDHVDDHR